MDNVITKLGGTPINLNLDSDKEDDILSNDAFAAKMGELVNAMDGSESGGSSMNDFANITIINNFSEGLENIELKEITGLILNIIYDNTTQVILNREFFCIPDKLKLPLSGGIVVIELNSGFGINTSTSSEIELHQESMDISVSGEIVQMDDGLAISGDGIIEITWTTPK
jgi:hypothetical protein